MRTLLIWVVGLVASSSALAGTPERAALSVSSFDLRDVTLGPGPFRDAMNRDRVYLLSLDPERLLHTFRINVGLPSTAKPYGGWEAPHVELRGHTLGHYLTACALMYRATGDAVFQQRIEAVVRGLAECQAAAPKAGFNPGYLSAFPESFIDRVEARQEVWAPWYTLHKVAAGLLDAHQLAGNAPALDVLQQMVAWVKFRVDRLTPEQMQGSLQMEHGGMTDVLANLYALTGNADHLRLAQAFEHAKFVEPLARGEDQLDGLHANTQIPKAIGAARLYELTNDARQRAIATTFWDRVALHRSYVIGGHSDREHFFPRHRVSPSPQPRNDRDVQHLQHAEADASPVRVDPRRSADGFLRARAVQPHPGLAGPGTRRVRVPHVARAGSFQNLFDARALVLVLRGQRHGKPREVWRDGLCPRARVALRQPVHPRRSALARAGGCAWSRRRRFRRRSRRG